MKFSMDWQDEMDNAAVEERFTIADLQILMNDQNVCQFIEGENTKPTDQLTVSVYPLVESIAVYWWNIFGQRDGQFRFVEHRGGYLLPDIRMKCNGEFFALECIPYSYANTNSSVFSFEPIATELHTRADVERTLDDLITETLTRLDSKQVTGTGLQLRWERVRNSREQKAETEFCEAAGAFGLDPYFVSDEEIALIQRAGAFFQQESLLEFFSAFHDKKPSVASCAIENALDWIESSEARTDDKSALPEVKNIRQHWIADDAHTNSNEKPWTRGYRCARNVRKIMGLEQQARFPTVEKLAEKLGSKNFESAGNVENLRAVVQSTDNNVNVHLRGSTANYNNTSMLFSLGRAIGDAVANPVATRSVINDLHEASRQAVGRAFAAEFLVPINEILSMREDNMDKFSIANEFGVSEQVIEHQIENHWRIQLAGSS